MWTFNSSQLWETLLGSLFRAIDILVHKLQNHQQGNIVSGGGNDASTESVTTKTEHSQPQSRGSNVNNTTASDTSTNTTTSANVDSPLVTSTKNDEPQYSSQSNAPPPFYPYQQDKHEGGGSNYYDSNNGGKKYCNVQSHHSAHQQPVVVYGRDVPYCTPCCKHYTQVPPPSYYPLYPSPYNSGYGADSPYYCPYAYPKSPTATYSCHSCNTPTLTTRDVESRKDGWSWKDIICLVFLFALSIWILQNNGTSGL